MDLSNIWVISDTHFRHERMHELCHRPRGYEELIIENWKANVKPDDLVIHLGDVAWPRGWDEDIISQLPGRKVLVKGNHDTKSLPGFMTKGFDLAVNQMVMHLEGLRVVFSHAPLPRHDFDINVHGHLHDLEIEDDGYAHWCCSLETQGYGVQNVKGLIKTWRRLAHEAEKWRG